MASSNANAPSVASQVASQVAPARASSQGARTAVCGITRASVSEPLRPRNIGEGQKHLKREPRFDNQPIIIIIIIIIILVVVVVVIVVVLVVVTVIVVFLFKSTIINIGYWHKATVHPEYT